MQRVAWTDERLDDLARRVDVGFDRVDRDIRELRGEVSSLRVELHSEMDSLRGTMTRVGSGVVVALVGVIATTALG